MRQHDAVEVGADRTWHPGIVIEEAFSLGAFPRPREGLKMKMCTLTWTLRHKVPTCLDFPETAQFAPVALA